MSQVSSNACNMNKRGSDEATEVRISIRCSRWMGSTYFKCHLGFSLPYTTWARDVRSRGLIKNELDGVDRGLSKAKASMWALRST